MKKLSWCTEMVTVLKPYHLRLEMLTSRSEYISVWSRSIAGAHVVNSNMQEVILALERDVVMVEVNVNSALQIVRRLKSIIEKIEDDARVEVRLFVEEGNYF